MLVHSLSIPRSGHHFLVSMRASYLGKGISYKSRGEDGIEWPDRATVRIVKSHDGKLTDPRDEARDALIVQTREPGTQIQSEVQRQLSRGTDLSIDDPEFLELWLAKSAIYYRGFRRKWTKGRRARTLIIDYDALRAAPEMQVAAALRLVGVEPDTGRVAAAIAGNRGLRPFDPSVPPEGRKLHVERVGLADGPLKAELVLDYVDACLPRPRAGRITRVMRVLEALRAPVDDFDALAKQASTLGNDRLIRMVRKARSAAAAAS